MRSTLWWAVTTVCAVGAIQGCTHTQLRWNTTHQARTLTDIYEQQVLDNLAMFVHDPTALPFFAHPGQGRSDVTDKGSIGSDVTWRRLGFDASVLKLGGNRDMYETWTFTPVHEVRRLELMRCAYQQALFSAGLCSSYPGCPDCDRLQRTFYTGDPKGAYNAGDTSQPDTLATFSAVTGRTTPGCFLPVQWLCFGERKDIPDDCDCLKKGHYCGTYVWVLPGGQDELTKLTLTILDYAVSPQAVKVQPRTVAVPTKEVTWFFGINGEPVPRGEAAQIIKATVPYDAVVRLRSGDIPRFQEAESEAGRMEQREQERERDPLYQLFRDATPFEQQPSYILPPIVTPRTGLSPLELELLLRNPQGSITP